MRSNQLRIVDHAIAYAARNWLVFPALTEGKTKKSHKAAEFSNGERWGATTNAAQIKRDFMRWSDANIGIATGNGSGIFVVECDTADGHDVDGIAAFRALEAEHGKLPTTRMAESPSGSLHHYFRQPADVVIREQRVQDCARDRCAWRRR